MAAPIPVKSQCLLLFAKTFSQLYEKQQLILGIIYATQWMMEPYWIDLLKPHLHKRSGLAILVSNSILNLYVYIMNVIVLHHPLDGVTSTEYKLLHFIQLTKFFYKEKKALAFNWDRCFHLVLCLWLIKLNFMNRALLPIGIPSISWCVS